MGRRSFGKTGIKVFLFFILIIFGLNRLIGVKNLSKIEALERKLKKEPNNSLIITSLADSYYKKAIHLDTSPESIPYLEGAISLYEKGYKINKDPKTAFHLGRAYFNIAKYSKKMEDYKKAEKNFLKAYEGGFVNCELFILLGHLYLIEGSFSKAIEFYEKALLLSKKDPVILLNIAFSYKEKKDLDKALSYLKMIDGPLDYKTYINLHLLLGEIYEKKGLYLLARKEYLAVLKKERKNKRASSAIKRLE